jgi:dolichol-phosphate mannosyltransferase
MNKLYIIVPVLNEAENLERLFHSFRQFAAEIRDTYEPLFIMVNDGSTDETSALSHKLATGLNFTLLDHATNQGPGKAFGTAFKHLAKIVREDDLVVTMEGDNTSRRELLKQMLVRSREGYDVVFASPYLYGGGITNTSSLRVILSNIANVFVKEFLGIHGIVTMSSFFRLYRGTTILQLQAHYGAEIVERAGFESMIEMLLKMIYLGMTISEIAMVLDTSQRAGKSKMKIVRTILGYLSLWGDKGRWQSTVKETRAAYSTSRSQHVNP